MCKDCDWKNTANQIESMLADDRYYFFAEDTLYYIMDWARENFHITRQQFSIFCIIRDSISYG